MNDLVHLVHLHEPALLHVLGMRYAIDTIYTFTGNILLAVNPFQRLPLYTPEVLSRYYSYGLLRGSGMEEVALFRSPLLAATRSYCCSVCVRSTTGATSSSRLLHRGCCIPGHGECTLSTQATTCDV